MDIISEREDGVLTVIPHGRFDGEGAGVFGEYIRSVLEDDDCNIAVGMAGVPYISSGGIRIILSVKKQMKKRGGDLVLYSVSEFPVKVLETSGLDGVFRIFDDRNSALKYFRCNSGFNIIEDLAVRQKRRPGYSLTIEHISAKKPDMHVSGSIMDLLNSRICESDVVTRDIMGADYSLGLGAMGDCKEDAMVRMGEFVTLKNTIAWFPTDESGLPDYFTVVSSSPGVCYYSGYSAGVRGRFNEIVTITPDDPVGGITAEGVSEEIFALAEERGKHFSGIACVVIWGILSEFSGRRIKKSPLKGNGPENRLRVDHPDNRKEWFIAGSVPEYRGKTMLAFGVLAKRDIVSPGVEDSDLIERIIPRGYGGNIFRNIHGVVFSGLSWDDNPDPERRISTAFDEGEVLDVMHVLGSTAFKKVRIGVYYI
jgi:anti-sigma B factor antagonist